MHPPCYNSFCYPQMHTFKKLLLAFALTLGTEGPKPGLGGPELPLCLDSTITSRNS